MMRRAAGHLRRTFSHRFLSTSTALLQKRGNIEDQEEAEREEQLRRQFQAAQPQTQGSGSGLFGGLSSMVQEAQKQAAAKAAQQGSSSGHYPSGQAGQMPSAGAINAAKLFQYLVMGVSVYALALVYMLNKEGSQLNVLQGIPMFALPADASATYLLLRTLIPFKQQAAIRKEFESANKIDSGMTLPQFIASRYPSIFEGHNTPFLELLAAMSACNASSGPAYVNTVQRTINRVGTKDVRSTIDAIMDALRADFPIVFSPGIAPPPSSFNSGFQSAPHVQLETPHSGTVVRFPAHNSQAGGYSMNGSSNMGGPFTFSDSSTETGESKTF